MQNKVKICLITLLMAMFACSVAALCSCAEDPPYCGTYYGGSSDDSDVVIITDDVLYIGTVSDPYLTEYQYKCEDGQIYLYYGENVGYFPFFSVYEDYQVLCANLLKNLGLPSADTPSTRDGYFDAMFRIMNSSYEITEFYNFSSSGSYSYTVIDPFSRKSGTYTLNNGLITLNTTSETTYYGTTSVNEESYIYIDSEYNICYQALVKDPELFTGNSSGTQTPTLPGDDGQTETTPQTYTINYIAGENGKIIGTTTQTVREGESGETVIAVADDGYEFVGWSDGVTTAERTDTNVTEDITVTAIFEAANTTQFAGGSGSESNPYKIATIEHLQNMSLYPDAHYILVSDITLPQAEEGQSNFTPLFSDETMFNGTLDGNGHTIYNLTIYNTSTFYTGLFSCIGKEGSVTNLTLENVDLYGTNYTGGIAGYALGEITDCKVSGKITYVQQNTYSVFIGGIAGRAESSVDGCASSVEIVAEDVSSAIYAGGIAGYYAYNMSNSETALTVYSSANINLTTNGDTYAGGIFGRVNATVSLTYSYATGDIEVTSDSSPDVGGLIGYAYYSSTLTSCYITGNIAVTADSGAQVGGLIGYAYYGSTLTSCYTTGNIAVTTDSGAQVGGLIGYSWHGGTLTSCYTTGDIVVTTTDFACVGGLIGQYLNNTTLSSCYTTGDIEVTSNYSAYIGGLIGDAYYGSTLTSCYTTGNIAVTTDSGARVGGLIGYCYEIGTLTLCYTTGNIAVRNNSAGYYTYVGGLIGYAYYGSTLTSCYNTGNIAITTDGSAYVGGMIGYLDGSSATISSSYTTSLITVESSAETNYIGALVGWTEKLTITNTHWLYYAESGVEYAVDYNSDMGMPTNIGATKHTDIADFYTLADALNDGLDTAVWENVGENSLPTLKEENN